MTSIHWLNAINGSFTNPADWSGGVVPGASDNAVLDAVGSAFTVTSGENEAVRSVRVASNATLSLTAGTFTADKGTGPGANAGIILVGPGATMVCGGTVTNSGTIALHGGKAGSAALVLKARVDNAGLVEASGSGGVTIGGHEHGGLYNSATGVVLAGDGSVVRVGPQAHLQGGTLESAGSGIFVANSAYIGSAGGDGLVVNARVRILGDCYLDGGIENDGTIIQAGGTGEMGLGVVTLTGDGVLELGGAIGFEGGAATVLTLAGGTISGGGSVSVGYLTVGAAGVFDSDTATLLVLSGSIANAGTIESTGSGGVLLDVPVFNTGTLSARRGTLTADFAVSGGGIATIGGGTLIVASSFDEAVTFTGGGVLVLGRSREYTNAVTGFSASGGTTLDLGDIRFVGAGEATFSGTASGGVLTVTDGTHTAHITLEGNYLGATFVASKDGHGGTDVVAEKARAIGAPVHIFISAMAGFGAPFSSHVMPGGGGGVRESPLISPRATSAWSR